MRFLVKFVLLVSVRKDIDFFAMYDEGFLIIRTNSLEGALAYLKGGAPIDAILIEKGPDVQPAVDLCNALKRCKPGIAVALIDDSETLSSGTVSADLVLDRSLTEVELANVLTEALVGSSGRESMARRQPALFPNQAALHS